MGNSKLITAAGALALLGAGLYRYLHRSRSQLGSLSGVVSYSSKMIAAARAVESEQEHSPLFHDPLAILLAGPAAMARAHQRAQARETGGVRKMGPMAVRTKWFDDRITDALLPSERIKLVIAVRGSHGSPYCAVSFTVTQVPAPARQCVMLGAGMDTRAWRLDLPPGVRWIEVDQPDVMRAKRESMQAAGGQMSGQANAATARATDHTASSTLHSQQADAAGLPGLQCPGAACKTLGHRLFGIWQRLWQSVAPLLYSRGAGGADLLHPLKAAAWVGVAADLSKPGWIKELLAQGLDPSQPIVWVAEGLLMYLDEAAVRRLLHAAAQSSVAGSRLLTMAVSEQALRRAQASQSELLQTWRSGLARDAVVPFFAGLGWRIVQCVSRQDFAGAYEIPGVRMYAENNENSQAAGQKSLFIEARIPPA